MIITVSQRNIKPLVYSEDRSSVCTSWRSLYIFITVFAVCTRYILKYWK